jgi:hypothetical protein
MAQLPTASAGEKECGFVPPLFAHPGPESLYRRPSKRSASLLSPFTFATDVGTATQVDVTLSESDEFRDPKPCLNGEEQQAAISSTKPTRLIRCGHERLNLRSSQEIHQSAGLPFWWDREYALDSCRVLRALHRRVANEGPDRGEPKISAARAIGSSFL